MYTVNSNLLFDRVILLNSNRVELYADCNENGCGVMFTDIFDVKHYLKSKLLWCCLSI